jgi:NADH dehydrogenase
MPLRVWLGAVWLFEGIKKILEGWFGSPKLNGFFNGANGWYESILNGGAAADGASGATAAAGAADAASAATGAAADAVSSATGAVGEAVRSVGTAILNFDFLGLFKAIFVSGKAPAESALADYAFKLDVPLVNSFINNLILPNESVQMFMQIFIVVAEILIGLALIGGLFTTPASAASLILQAMFVTTTGLLPEHLLDGLCGHSAADSSREHSGAGLLRDACSEEKMEKCEMG